MLYTRLEQQDLVEDADEKGIGRQMRQARQGRLWAIIVSLLLIAVAGITGYGVGIHANRIEWQAESLQNTVPRGMIIRPTARF